MLMLAQIIHAQTVGPVQLQEMALHALACQDIVEILVKIVKKKLCFIR